MQAIPFGNTQGKFSTHQPRALGQGCAILL